MEAICAACNILVQLQCQILSVNDNPSPDPIKSTYLIPCTLSISNYLSKLKHNSIYYNLYSDQVNDPNECHTCLHCFTDFKDNDVLKEDAYDCRVCNCSSHI